jgi:agmatine/peptidylarginine deiminase
MSHTEHRLPAEWERQSATLLAWPNEKSDWASNLAAIQEEYLALITAITRRQKAVVLVPPGNHDVAARLGDRAGLHLVEVPYNDTWCRDYGFITLVSSGQRLALDFHFNGWGGKYPAGLDNRVNTLLSRHELFNRFSFRQYLFEIEGGAIDSDGHGRLLVNWHCLHTRQPHLKRGEISHELHQLLNIDEVIGIDIEPVPGDDTDGHIDTLARFLDRDVIAFQIQNEAARTETLRSQLETLRKPDGHAYDLLALPKPEGVDPSLPANYVNFLFINDACLVPAYGSKNDEEARAILAEALPDREVELVPARAMIRQFGGIHCATMHIPAALG